MVGADGNPVSLRTNKYGPVNSRSKKPTGEETAS